MPRPTRLEIAKNDIFAVFAEAGDRVYTRLDLAKILREHRNFWRLAQSTTVADFASFLEQRGALRHIRIQADEPYAETLDRYTWGDLSTFRLATAIRRGSYLCHGTAALVHGLTDLNTKTVYINDEQTAKPGGGRLTQRGIDLAFSRPQRTSKLTFKLRDTRVLVVSGKNTGHLGVEMVVGPDGDELPCTSVERTLIDITVRPSYAGGIHHVAQAFKRSMGNISVNRLYALLKKLDYTYPYHQAIGFLMQHAGYPKERYELLREMPIEFDFYLDHKITEPKYDAYWKLYFPRELQAID